jgi:hypothetical protein
LTKNVPLPAKTCQILEHAIAFQSPGSRRIRLHLAPTGVIHVVIAVIDRARSFKMTFTIDVDNNITAVPTSEAAAAAVAAGAQTFSSQQELAELAAAWPADRLVEIWNSLPGVKPVKGFKNAQAAVGRIWGRVQNLGEPEKPNPQRKAKSGAQAAKGAPAKTKAHKKATPAKAPKPPKKAAAKNPEVREGSKTAQVVAMLQRKGGATLAEIISKMGWQKHTVRGFMAGTMKKAGYAVESFKPEGGERTYRISR